MGNQQTSFVHRGNTFFGTVDEIDRDGEQRVRVRYNGEAREAKLDGFPVDVVAHLLLRDLVLQDVGLADATRSGAPWPRSLSAG